ncbi:TPA: hypothetical protein N0F65_009832 [Lagenidium giganteum]|uniref:DNA-(apurinic or apyrimidinic site) endonuclease n=1 Tax=Lagenidium giganteum TaxID=4803 RepID=A0AAV2YV89_9STRA|nr:TPA: hypothetical protein N0F65_009832 [Lagenidium giganteum]
MASHHASRARAMAGTRQSKRLQASVTKAVATAVTKTKTKATTTRKAATKRVAPAKSESPAAADDENDDKNENEPTPKRAKASSSKKNDASKSAWDALFAKQKKTAAAAAVGGIVRPAKLAGGVNPAELQAKIDAFASLELPATSENKQTEGTTKLVAWNVNGLRALLKKDEGVYMRAYVAQEDPDVLCLSETKIAADELQKIDDILPQYEHQYWTCAERKGYSGTAVLSKTKPLQVLSELVVENDKPDNEGRFLALEFDRFWLVHTYVPNAGQNLDRLDYRTTQWDKALQNKMKELDAVKPVVWCGDLNVAHEEIDIHDPKSNKNKSAGFTDAERESFGNFLSEGFVDSFRHLHPEDKQYTYWSYRFNARTKNKGWRLDYFVTSKVLMDSVLSSFVRDTITGSDHVPIGLELALGL